MKDPLRPVPRRTFEALLRGEVVAMTEALEHELRALGVDVRGLATSYSLETLRATYDCLRRHACPGLPAEEGFREIGHRFVRAFKATPIGWIFSAMAPLFGPDRTIQTLPRYLASAREDFQLTVTLLGDGRYRLVCPDPQASPHFMAGCVEAALETAGAKAPRAEVLSLAQGFELDISWAG